MVAEYYALRPVQRKISCLLFVVLVYAYMLYFILSEGGCQIFFFYATEQALMIVSPLADIAPEASPLMNILIIKIMDMITEKTKREPTAVIKKMKKKTADIKKVGDKK